MRPEHDTLGLADGDSRLTRHHSIDTQRYMRLRQTKYDSHHLVRTIRMETREAKAHETLSRYLGLADGDSRLTRHQNIDQQRYMALMWCVDAEYFTSLRL